MYIAANRTADGVRPRSRFSWAVPGNVLALGAVSLVTDISSEMVTAVLPLYVTLSLGLSMLQFGALDGLYFGVTALVRLAGGQLADRWQRRKLVAGAGYGLSALCKLGLLAAGGSPAALGGVIAADRTGKGLRTAPRDALISLSAPPDRLGHAFGVHRAMDTFGALLGPLAAFAVLMGTGGAYDAVFVVSFCVALLGLLLLAMYVRDHREPLPGGPRAPASVRAAFGLLRDAPFRRLCVAAAALGLVTVSDAFVYLLLQKGGRIDPAYFPLLPLGTAAAYLLLAVPAGRFADRLGRLPVFLAGHLALVAAYLVLLGPGWLPVVLVLHGAFYAATDGVLMAVAGPMLPGHLRTSGLALLQTGQATARMFSSVLFGAVWTVWGGAQGLAIMAAGLTVCVLAAWSAVRAGVLRSGTAPGPAAPGPGESRETGERSGR
ncbi:MFS family permease [Streptosporangium becharense]|uniref:MFS family permease n=1 Tax=Streptosporangium becharense TaxID=1816182 RepID=A0A7W9MFA6_9ACTN|nr:MFS transporter [Streptosporangium becharense]MBB2912884.1 MFS family permease [Streptosporangium becharense]MBB5818291.1 MFS family permease [Streptosporangium becharense]